MFIGLCQFFFERWTCFVRSARGFWRTLLRRLTGRPVYPLTSEQQRAEEDKFVAAVSRDAIRALASRHNGNLPCQLRDETTQGSFNICFYAEFSTVGTTWVVRVPIEPAVGHAWEKLQSEVYTMQYIRAKTSIPVPQVHAHGRAQLLTGQSTTQPFVIMDCVPGCSFTQERYWEHSESDRRQFFSSLIDILVQLYNLEFPAAGSLMPNPNEDSEPAIVRAFSVPRNTLLRNGYRMRSSAAKSRAQFLEEQFWILDETYKMPTMDLSREDLQMEVFALHDLKKRIFEVLGGSKDPFVLTHTDLRQSNILVDQSLRITGIIDWEWSSAMPRELFPFPRWIHNFGGRNFYDMRQEFRSVLQSKREESIAHSQLADKWRSGGNGFKADDDNDVASLISRIFRDAHDLVHVYFGDIYQYYFSRPEEEEVADFFSRPENKSLMNLVERRLDNCRVNKVTPSPSFQQLLGMSHQNQSLSEAVLCTLRHLRTCAQRHQRDILIRNALGATDHKGQMTPNASPTVPDERQPRPPYPSRDSTYTTDYIPENEAEARPLRR